MATTKPRATQEREGRAFGYGQLGATSINRGAIVALQAGLAIAGVAAANLAVVGIAMDSSNNSDGLDGDIIVQVKRGTFLVQNSTSDAIVAADIGADCFLEDDETVAKTDNGGTLSRAGVIAAIDANGVWVEFDGRT